MAREIKDLISEGGRLPRILHLHRSSLRKEAVKKKCEDIDFYDVRSRAEYINSDLVIFFDDVFPFHAKCLKSKFSNRADWPSEGQIGTKEKPLPHPFKF